jgi:ADP-dependent NAD(P)H-hydrate dehydratase / NAD(P)H-hydrate epimerase
MNILTVAEMRAADAAAVAAGAATIVLMRRAGEAVAAAVQEHFEKGPAWVLAGPGDNGGDAYIAAETLRAAGWPVRLAALAPPRTEAAREAAAGWTGPVHSLEAVEDRGELFIDGLFGAGLNAPLSGVAARLARRLGPHADRVVAIDTPSGLHGDTAKGLGEETFAAALTVTFHRPKPAHVLEPGRSLCGKVVIADIGLGETPSTVFENQLETWLARFPWPGRSAHKHARGRLKVISGGPSNTGAARLAARAGLRVGAGLVTVLASAETIPVLAPALEAIMVRAFDSDPDLVEEARNADAVIIGPAAGVTDATAANTLALAEGGAALVVDADALTVFRDDPAELFRALDRDDVLTPHPGEFRRVFPGLLESAVNRIEAVRRAAQKAGSVVLLKGPDTVIGAPDGRVAVNMNGTPWLATAGSGDVLAGVIGGLLAQGMAGFDAACAGAWLHAACGAEFGPGLISEDLPDIMPRVLKAMAPQV